MVLARVCWVPEKEGGRKAPPAEQRYITVARFAEDKSWPDEAWSLVVDFTEPTSHSLCWMASVGFLVAEAPVHLLKKERRFELYEGRRCVAQGEILADQLSDRQASESLTA